MGLVAHLVAKDLKRKMRSPLGLIAVLCFPLLFAGMIALAFGRGDSIPKVRMLVANEDEVSSPMGWPRCSRRSKRRNTSTGRP